MYKPMPLFLEDSSLDEYPFLNISDKKSGVILIPGLAIENINLLFTELISKKILSLHVEASIALSKSIPIN